MQQSQPQSQPQPLQFMQEDRQGIELLIEALIPLSDVSFGGKLAMRSIDEGHVETLLVSDMLRWEPVKVTRLSGGYYCYYDGQHRIEAASRGGYESIIADCKTFKSEEELIDAAFQANLRHGLPATTEYRGDYAFWLYLTFGNKLTQEQIAQLAGMRQGSVSKAIAKREQRLQQRMQEQGNVQKKESADDALKSKRRLIAAAQKFYAEVSTEDYKQLVEEMHGLAKNVSDRDALYFLGQLLTDAMKPPALVRLPSLTITRS